MDFVHDSNLGYELAPLPPPCFASRRRAAEPKPRAAEPKPRFSHNTSSGALTAGRPTEIKPQRRDWKPCAGTRKPFTPPAVGCQVPPQPPPPGKSRGNKTASRLLPTGLQGACGRRLPQQDNEKRRDLAAASPPAQPEPKNARTQPPQKCGHWSWQLQGCSGLRLRFLRHVSTPVTQQ